MSYSFIKKGKRVPEKFKDSEILFFSSFAKDMILWNYNLIKSVLDYIEKNMKKDEYLKGLLSLNSNVIIDIAETTFRNLKDNFESLTIPF